MAHKKEGKERISDPRVDRIWEYMREKKINLTKLSKVSGLSYPHVNNMMNGNKSLSYDVLEKIAIGLKLPMEYFIDNIGQRIPPVALQRIPVVSLKRYHS